MKKIFIKKEHKKYFICLFLALIIFVFFLIDLFISGTYAFDVTVNPSPALADGKTPVTIEVALTRFGEPVKEHELTAIVDGGSFKSGRVITDENGKATFVYIPYLSSAYQKAETVYAVISDDSNSILVSVPARKKVEIKLYDGETQSGGSLVDDIFG